MPEASKGLAVTATPLASSSGKLWWTRSAIETELCSMP